MKDLLRASSKSDPAKLGGAIANVIRKNGIAEVDCLGAGPVNQALKSVAAARSYLASEGVEVICYPSFVIQDIDDGRSRTTMRLIIEIR
ncbi:stage V sporulation protein S [Bacillus phage vB_BauM_KLEB27-3]|nr:stage V sporulation protein S [Bacillus phage vB_BauM_KLEB27-3]